MGIAVLYPVIAQIILTLVVMFGMAVQRQRAFSSGEVKPQDAAVDSRMFPTRARQFGNCYSNQFELPVLFYVLCLIAQITRTADLIFVILAWIFVASRVLHAVEHTTTNVVTRRGALFGIGLIVVIIMTAYLLFRLLVPLV
jgi:hypothetical protein